MANSVGLAKDLRLCTRISMPSGLLQQSHYVGPPTQQDSISFKNIVEQSSKMAESGKTGKEYDELIKRMAEMVLKHVRPNNPSDCRLLFSCDSPCEPFKSQSEMTAKEYYSWLDVDKMREAVQIVVDVSENSKEPKKQ